MIMPKRVGSLVTSSLLLLLLQLVLVVCVTGQELNCGTCIDRSTYTIQAIVHGNPTIDSIWDECIQTFEQVSKLYNVKILVTSNTTGTSTSYSMSNEITQAISNSDIDAIIVTIPNIDVVTTLESILGIDPTLSTVNDTSSTLTNARKPIFAFNVGTFDSTSTITSTPEDIRRYNVIRSLDGIIAGSEDDPIIGTIAATEFVKLFSTGGGSSSNGGGGRKTRALRKKSNSIQSTSNDNENENDNHHLYRQTQLLSNNTASSNLFTNNRVAIYVEAVGTDVSQSSSYTNTNQYNSFATTLYKTANVLVTQRIQIDISSSTSDSATVDLLFQGGCPYNIILLNSKELVDIVLAARDKYNCNTSSGSTNGAPLIGVTQVSATIYKRIVTGDIAFAIDTNQIYLQTSLVSLLTSSYITTGLTIPSTYSKELNTVPLTTGPIVYTKNNIPSDTIQIGQSQAFPICSISTTSSLTTGTTSPANGPCNDRTALTIAGVVHGLTTDPFWDIVFEMSKQAAIDMGNINLLMDRFEPVPGSNGAVSENTMAAKITSLCQSDVDGIFVSIPSKNITNSPIVDSIKSCQNLQIPIISINSGYDIAVQLNIPYHVSSNDYQQGYNAGKYMIENGMKYGFCLDHESGNDGIRQRCLGFQNAIVEDKTGTVQYMGHYPVPLDNDVKYKIDVEAMVSTSTIPDSIKSNTMWDSIGMLITGVAQVPAFRTVHAVHTNVIAGTFDTSTAAYDAIRDGIVLFTTDSQAALQGNIPIYLLTTLITSTQGLIIRPPTTTNSITSSTKTLFIDTGKPLITQVPDVSEILCTTNLFKVCSYNSSDIAPDNGNGGGIGTIPPIDVNTSNPGDINIFEPYVKLMCDPCIQRHEYSIVAIVHGSKNDEDWIQIEKGMNQAALSMNVDFKILLQDTDTYDPNVMAEMIRTEALNTTKSAFIVTIPDSIIQHTIIDITQQYNKPVFGFNVGYQLAHVLGLQGYVGQNDYYAGTVAGLEFIKYFSTPINTSATSTSASIIFPLTSAAYVRTNSAIDLTSQYQLEAFKEGLGANVTITDVVVDVADTILYEYELNNLFTNCPYQAILLSSKVFITSAIDKRIANGCINTQIGVVGVNVPIYDSITKQSLLFAIDQDMYLQGSVSVITAALFITTGKALRIPDGSSYLSRAVAIRQNNVPSDSTGKCQSLAFPYCDREPCECRNRNQTVIAAVLHGDLQDSFWDPVYKGAAQAAEDMNIDFRVQRPPQPTNKTEHYQRMAALINNYCGQGVAGIIVTLPDPIVVEAVMNCKELNIPVVSINAGEQESEDNELLHHIAQDEFSAGYESAVKLAEAGMKFGFCLNHDPGFATIQRCAGFEKAITEKFSDTVTYAGMTKVASDNFEQFKIDVTKAITEASVDGTKFSAEWDTVGILILSSSYVVNLAELRKDHPNFIAGTFDTGVEAYLQQGWLKFGIDQQPFLQGSLPVYLLSYMSIAYGQSLSNQKIKSGPKFIEQVPSEEEVTCSDNDFQVCPDAPAENFHLVGGLKVFGYVMFSIIAAVCIATGTWVFVNRNEWVVKVGQPPLLGLVIFGCLVSSLSIIFIGYETEYRYLQDPITKVPNILFPNPDIHRADASCMAFPWLYGMGFVLTFSSLFAKIHRVKMIYRAGMKMQRKTIGFKDVAYIGAFLFLIELSILVSWQIASPLRWERKAISFDSNNQFPLESVGGCSYEDSAYFFSALVAFHVLCLFYALALCFQTKDINSDFAESSYISLAVAFMFQVLVLSVPICVLVRSITEVFYVIRVLSIFLQNFTVLALMFAPKIVKHRNRPRDGTRAKGEGYQINGRSMIQSRLSMAPGDPSRQLLMSEQMQSQMAIQGFQGLSDNNMRKSAVLQNPISDELFLSEVSSTDDRPERKPSSKFSDSILSRSFNRSSHGHKSKGGDTTERHLGDVLSTVTIIDSWKELGFQSVEQARNVVSLLSKSISVEERQLLLFKLIQIDNDNDNDNDNRNEQHPTTTTTKSYNDSDMLDRIDDESAATGLGRDDENEDDDNNDQDEKEKE